MQRILNLTIRWIQSARVIFEDLETSDIALDAPADWGGRKVEDYLVRLRDGQSMLLRASQDYLKKNQRKRSSDGRKKGQNVAKFEIGQHVLLKYPNKPPDKLSALYRVTMEIVAIILNRPDIVKFRELTTNKVSSVHTSRLRIFRHPTQMSKEELEALSAVDLDDY